MLEAFFTAFFTALWVLHGGIMSFYAMHSLTERKWVRVRVWGPGYSKIAFFCFFQFLLKGA
jgi:hypothetical protein